MLYVIIMFPPTRVGRHIGFPLASVGLSACPSQDRVHSTVRLLVPGHFNFCAVSKVLLRANNISVIL